MLHLRRLGGRGRSASARTTPRRPLSVERLEGRHLPSGLTFQFLLDDPNHQFDAFPLLRTDLNAVGQVYSGLLNGQGTIEVSVQPDNSIPEADGSTVGVFPAYTRGGETVLESAALAEARTGVNPNGSGPEILLKLNTQSFLPSCWFDPSGAARAGQVPADKTDFISVALHEVMHGLGFQGYRTIGGPGYGTLPTGYESAYDALTSFGSGANSGILFFLGPRAEAVYGGPVPLTSVGPSAPLTSQNFYHVGNPTGPGTGLLSDLMNGIVFNYGTRYNVSALDLAVLADQGWSVPGFPAPATPAVPPGVAPLQRRGHANGHQHGHHRHGPPRLGRRPRPFHLAFRLA